MAVLTGAFIISFFLSALITPLVISQAFKRGAGLAKPGGRKIHAEPTPQIGGIALFTSIFATYLTLSALSTGAPSVATFGLFIGCAIVFLTGLRDDFHEMPALVKLFAQIFAAVVLVVSGIKIQFITNPFSSHMVSLGLWGAAATVFWVVAVTNAINLVDGLDGLAAGISLIACFIFLVLLLIEARHQPRTLLLCMSTAGACLGFLRYNFHPARIFMGDSGAYSLGFLLAAMAVLGALKSAAMLTLAAPLLVLGIPLLDMVSAVLRRTASGTGAFKPDKAHIHHKLMDMGFSQKQTVLLIYGVCVFLGAIAILLVKAK